MKKQNLFQNAGATVALMIGATLVSKVLGMLRQMMTASIFAASMEGIAFSAASGIPLAIFDMLFSTAVLGSFLPIYRGHLDLDGKRAESFSSSFLTGIFLITALTSVLGIVFARPIMRLSAPDLNENTFDLAVRLLRIMFPSMIFAGAAYTLVGILQSHESFLIPSLVSAVSNLILIFYLLFSSSPIGESSVVGFAFAYLISWLIQFLTLAVPLWKKRQLPRPTLHLKTPDTALAVRRALPVMCGSWLIPMTNLIAKSFSSFVAPEGITSNAQTGAAIVVYESAFSVFSIAAGLLTYGICNYIFPKISAEFAQGHGESFSRLVQHGFFSLSAMTLPVASALILLSDEMIKLLYLRGNFTLELAWATGESLKILAFAMPAYAMTEFFSRVCYACGQVRYPMWASISGIAITLLALSCSFLLKTLSVGTVTAAVVYGQTAAGVLLLLCCLRFCGNKSGCLTKKYAYLFAGFFFSFIVMWMCRNFFRQILNFSETFQNFLVITIVFALGFVVYSIWLILLGVIRFSDVCVSVGDKSI